LRNPRFQTRAEALLGILAASAVAGCAGAGSSLTGINDRSPRAVAPGTATPSAQPTPGLGGPLSYNHSMLGPSQPTAQTGLVAVANPNNQVIYADPNGRFFNMYDPNNGSFAVQYDTSGRDASGRTVFTVAGADGSRVDVPLIDPTQLPVNQPTTIGSLTMTNGSDGSFTVTPVGAPNPEATQGLTLKAVPTAGGVNMVLADNSSVFVPVSSQTAAAISRAVRGGRHPEYAGDANCTAAIAALVAIIAVIIAVIVACFIWCGTLVGSIATGGGLASLTTASGAISAGGAAALQAAMGVLRALALRLLGTLGAAFAAALAAVTAACGPRPTPTPSPTASPTPSGTATPTAHPTATPTAHPTATPTALPTATTNPMKTGFVSRRRLLFG
jgi:hypothetical protein